MTDKITCLVPFCAGRSAKWSHCVEYLCAKHYRLADADLRAQHSKNGRMIRQLLRENCTSTELERQDAKVWDKIKEQALAAAFDENHEDPLAKRKEVRHRYRVAV